MRGRSVDPPPAAPRPGRADGSLTPDLGHAGTGLAGLGARVLGKLRELGPAYVGQRLLMRLPRRLFFVNVFIVFELDLRGRQFAAAADPDIRWATREDLDLLTAPGHLRAELRARFDRGARACILERAGRLLGQAWLDPGDHDRDGCLLLRAAPADVWSVDGWVAPEARGRGLFNRLKATAAADAARAGYARMLNCVDLLNRNSIRANLAIGARPIGRVLVLRLLGLTLVRSGRLLRLGRWREGDFLRLPLAAVAMGAAEAARLEASLPGPRPSPDPGSGASAPIVSPAGPRRA